MPGAASRSAPPAHAPDRGCARSLVPCSCNLLHTLKIPAQAGVHCVIVSSLRKQGPTTQLARALVSKRNGWIEVDPLRIVRFDELDFPRPFPFLDLPLSGKCCFQRGVLLVPYQPIYAVPGGETRDGFHLVLPNALHQVGCHPDIQCSKGSAAQEIDIEH